MSLGIEFAAKLVSRNVFASLPKNRVGSSGVELAVGRDGQRLFFTRRAYPLQFDVAAAL